MSAAPDRLLQACAPTKKKLSEWLNESLGGSEDGPAECPVGCISRRISEWLDETLGGSEDGPAECPVGCISRIISDDSPSHPEATLSPSGWSDCAEMQWGKLPSPSMPSTAAEAKRR